MRRLIAVSREGARMGRFIAVSRSIRIALGLLRQEMGSLRVMLGYLLGMTFLALALNDFFGYAMEIKEPVNIWEAFIVMGNQSIPGRFWVLGYLFVIADAPFVRRNTYMLLYLGGFWGLMAVAAVHVGGAVLSFAGRLHQSPVYYVDGAGSWWRYPGMMAVCIFAMAFVSMTAAGRVDIQAR